MRTASLVLFGTVFAAAFGAAGSACAGEATVLGTGIGAAAGGLFGSQIGHGSGQLVATGMGVAVGGLIGNDVGHEMDAETPHYTGGSAPPASDPTPPIAYNAYAPNYVAPPAPPPTYVNPEAGTYCREYSQEIRIDGQTQESYGTACLQPDGSWRIVQ